MPGEHSTSPDAKILQAPKCDTLIRK